MGGVVVDTNAVVRAILSPTGARRKLWMLLVYGGAVHRAARMREAVLLAREMGGPFEGRAERALALSEAAAEAIGALLPPDTPDNFWVVASPALLGEYHRKLHDLRAKLPRPPWTETQIEYAFRSLVAACAEITPDFDVLKVPRYTDGRDRDDDLVIHTALVGSASLLISNDVRDVSLDRGGETVYGDDQGRTVSAVTFEHFAATYLDADLGAVDGTLLPAVYDLFPRVRVPRSGVLGVPTIRRIT